MILRSGTTAERIVNQCAEIIGRMHASIKIRK